MHPTIKFTAEWPKISINFSDVTVSFIEKVTETDFYVKPIDRHQFLQPGLCQSFNCKISIPYKWLTRTHNHLVPKRTLNHLAQLVCLA